MRTCRTLIASALPIFALLIFGLKVLGQVTSPAELQIAGAVSTPLSLTLADLKAMPHKTVKVQNTHNQKTETYEGVPVEALLERAGVPHGEALRGAAMTEYVLVEATDGYSVTFSLAELDSGISDSEVLVADSMDGTALGKNEGPLKLVAPHEKRPARWVRMVKSLSVVKPN